MKISSVQRPDLLPRSLRVGTPTPVGLYMALRSLPEKEAQATISNLVMVEDLKKIGPVVGQATPLEVL